MQWKLFITRCYGQWRRRTSSKGAAALHKTSFQNDECIVVGYFCSVLLLIFLSWSAKILRLHL